MLTLRQAAHVVPPSLGVAGRVKPMFLASPLYMTRWLAALALAGALANPMSGAADELYSFVDGDGVTHYTNVPHDPHYHLVAGQGARPVDADVPLDPHFDRAGKSGGGTRASQRAITTSRPGRVAPPLPRRDSAFEGHIRAAARKYGLAPPLLKAVMAAESNFDPAAISEKGATGLMQLMPATARDMYVHDALDPMQNIEGGARYLRQLQDRFDGDLERMLAAYNAGPERVRRSGGAVPAIPETQAYVRKVLGLYRAYLNGG